MFIVAFSLFPLLEVTMATAVEAARCRSHFLPDFINF
jgi:hypothetical protein